MANKEVNEQAFKKISTDILRLYNEKIHEYLDSQETGSLTDSDVVIMIMNLTLSISTNIFYSLKQILPTTTIDFDFVKVKIINSLVDSFEKIKEYKPNTEMLPLTTEQVKEVVEKGETKITMPDGSEKKITKNDILVKKEDVEKIMSLRSAPIIGANTPKIILPPSKH